MSIACLWHHSILGIIILFLFQNWFETSVSICQVSVLDKESIPIVSLTLFDKFCNSSSAIYETDVVPGYDSRANVGGIPKYTFFCIFSGSDKTCDLLLLLSCIQFGFFFLLLRLEKD